MNSIELKTTTRASRGNSPARELRRNGRIPAILYGRGTQPRMLSVDTRELENVLKGGNVGRSIFNLTIDDSAEPKSAMIKELQVHPVSHGLIHVDFYEVDMARKVRVNVPVVTTGKAVGVDMGGMLQIVRRELEVLCLPNAIPQTITIDISNLNVGDAVHVEEIHLDGDVEIPHDVNFTVLTVVSLKKAGEGEGAEEGAEGEAAKGAEGAGD